MSTLPGPSTLLVSMEYSGKFLLVPQSTGCPLCIWHCDRLWIGLREWSVNLKKKKKKTAWSQSFTIIFNHETLKKKGGAELKARDKRNKHAWAIDFIISFHPSFVLSLFPKECHYLSLHIQVLGRVCGRMKYQHWPKIHLASNYRKANISTSCKDRVAGHWLWSDRLELSVSHFIMLLSCNNWTTDYHELLTFSQPSLKTHNTRN